MERDPDRPSNLWEALDGADGVDHGAHGSFDDRARPTSPQVWLSQHRDWIVAATAAAAGGVAVLVNRLPHGEGWTLRSVAAILANPRYTGRQIWNRQYNAGPDRGRSG
ncbi:recombinase family protein [Micromonospora sp. CPCC 206061]|uniref:recombinase family protein n=1 Tax=Micromonospora sp. CPCC 206061 TaxID=3122410 RepID=UPI002FF16769